MQDSLTRSRLDSLSDGVIAVILTIMVLDLKVPGLHEMSTHDAIHLDLRILAVYLLSFVQIGIYWVNHHYLMDDLKHVSHSVLWANLFLLFTLSLIPFGTDWIGVRGVTSVPVAIYSVCFLLPAVAWTVLANLICRRTGIKPAASFGKQAFSSAMNVGAVVVAFWHPVLSLAMVGCVAIVWLVPPRRIREKTRSSVVSSQEDQHSA